MAKETPTEIENLTTAEQPAAAGSSMFGKLKILIFIVVVVAVEVGVACWYLSSAEESALLASTSLVDEKQAKKEADQEDEEKKENEQVEMDLGEFNVTSSQPVSNTTLRIDFRLFGTIMAKEKEEFEKRMEEIRNRFRDQIIVTVRSSEVSDLTDPGLGLVKRKILDKTNRMLGKPYLQSVIFTEFSFIEQ